MQCFISVNPNK